LLYLRDACVHGYSATNHEGHYCNDKLLTDGGLMFLLEKTTFMFLLEKTTLLNFVQLIMLTACNGGGSDSDDDDCVPDSSQIGN
jgi:hypothetical protein